MQLFHRSAMALLMATLAVACASCSSATSGSDDTELKLHGAGASFPFPLYQRWFIEYGELHPNVQVNYQSIGSGGGIQQLIQHTVDFAASDAAMDDKEIAEVPEGVQLLPMTAGSIVLAYNLPDAPKDLKLSREAYTGIFLGKVKKWNDPLIAKSNPDVKLPETNVTVVRRADSSGTTFVFTKHLAEISKEWKDGPGVGKSVDFPVGIGGKGNEGVTATIKQTPGAIGYIEFGYLKQAQLPVASLENKSGAFVAPDLKAAEAALASVKMPEDLRAWLPDPEGKESYPIVTYTWLLCYKKYPDAARSKALKDVVKFCLSEGQKSSAEMGYVPLPAEVVAKVTAALGNIKP
jgi:phosphate transport system substrate-binding protein